MPNNLVTMWEAAWTLELIEKLLKQSGDHVGGSRTIDLIQKLLKQSGDHVGGSMLSGSLNN